MDSPRLDSEEKALASLCAKCGGKCCRSHFVPLSEKEYGQLKKVRDFRDFDVNSPVGVKLKTIDAFHGDCDFLGEDGCALGSRMRPAICRLFPLVFSVEEGEIRFYLSGFCPHGKEVMELREWQKNAKDDVLEELKTSWSKKEVLCLGRYFRENKKKLIELPE
jgi:Fe-S-cluster containining protein